jgi:hypothetical protein
MKDRGGEGAVDIPPLPLLDPHPRESPSEQGEPLALLGMQAGQGVGVQETPVTFGNLPENRSRYPEAAR